MKKNMNTIEKISLRENKALKLNNVLIREVNESEFMNMDKLSYMMDSYIKSKGNSAVGPMVNYSAAEADETGQLKVIVKLMVQLKNPIHNTEAPYKFNSQIRVPNCLFARFHEKEEYLQMAYSKIQLHAFENDIKLKGDSYTVFVDNKEGKLIADVFMEVSRGDIALESV